MQTRRNLAFKRSRLLAGMVWLLLLSILVAAGPAAAAEPPAPDTPEATNAIQVDERWYAMLLQGSRAGYMHERTEHDGEHLTSSAKMHLTIRRGDQPLDISMNSRTVETADGKMVSMSSTMNLGAAPVTKTYTFGRKRVRVVTEPGDGPATTTTEPLPEGDWLSPGKASEFVQRKLDEGAKTITVRTVDPTIGLKPVRYTRSIGERTNIDLLGRTAPAISWTSVVDLYPTVANTEYVNEQGELLKTEISFGAMRFELLLADKDLALSKLDPPELMASTLIKPGRPIRNARALSRATYILSFTQQAHQRGDEPALPDLPTTGSQTTERLPDGRVRVVVRAEPKVLLDGEGCDDPIYLRPSVLIDSAHPAVTAVLPPGSKGSDKPSALARAEQLRRFVYEHVRDKSLGVGFASASEVARTREGDCSEHAVLLCALLRAEGIPGRVVNGVVYVDHFAGTDDIFGYHMWTQAGITDAQTGQCHWVDLDASISRDRAFDAAHIALDVSAMAEDESVNAMVRLAPLIGTLKIEVVDTAGMDP